jgi:hypothetical protein
VEAAIKRMSRRSLSVSAHVRTAVLPALIAGLAVAVLSLWLTAPRLSITGPSLIDDWTEIRWSPLAFHQLLHLAYDPSTYDAGRYRPGFWGFWAELQWHTFGAPGILRSPNLWNFVRNGLFGLGLAAVVVAGIRPQTRDRLGIVWVTVLGAIPGALVVSTPQLARDFARFGPQEPLLVGAMAVGLVLVLAALPWWGGHRGRRGCVALAVALAVFGVVCWIVGVYQKEAAICAAVLAPFLVMELRQRWPEGSGAPRWAIWGLGVLLLLPLAHMLFEVKRVSDSSHVVYGGAEVPHGLSGWYHRFVDAFRQQWGAISGAVDAPVWKWIAVLSVVLLAWTWLRARSVPWLALGLLLLALATLIFQGLPLLTETRYLIAPLGIVAAVCVMLVADGPVWLRSIVVVGAVVLVAAKAGPSRQVTRDFAQQEQAGVRLVSAVTQLRPQRCPVYLASFDLERTFALPELVAVRGETNADCVKGYEGLLVLSKIGGTAADDRILQACRAPGWELVQDTELASITGCRRFKRTVRSPDGAVVPVSEIVDHDRLRIPASPYVSRTPERGPLQPVQKGS